MKPEIGIEARTRRMGDWNITLRLGRKVPDEQYYGEIVSGCIRWHLGATPSRTIA